MSKDSSAQLELFAHVVAAYTDSASGQLDNASLYAVVAERARLTDGEIDAKVPIGRTGARRSPVKRSVRWIQQTCKALGVLERVSDSRAVWRLCAGKGKLHEAQPGTRLVAFSTRLGVAIWGDSHTMFHALDQPVALCVTSPPFLLQNPRAYGNPTEKDYVDFVCATLEPIVRQLLPGGSICLNVGNSCFEQGLPSRSLYRERLILALHERLGLHKVDELVWWNPSRPPGPTRWACVEKVQLKCQWEPIYWLTNRPECLRSDNRRVLEAHTERQTKLIAAGGETRTASYADGAHKVRKGAFARATPGKIPSNVLVRGHRCADSDAHRRAAAELGLPVHGAMQPTWLADFLIRFLSQEDELIVDPWGGSLKTALAAERLGRRWMVADKMLDYLRSAAETFRGFPGFDMAPEVTAWPNR